MTDKMLKTALNPNQSINHNGDEISRKPFPADAFAPDNIVGDIYIIFVIKFLYLFNTIQ